jgi:hypothetical protein
MLEEKVYVKNPDFVELKKILGLKFLLFPYSSSDICPETYSHGMRHA